MRTAAQREGHPAQRDHRCAVDEDSAPGRACHCPVLVTRGPARFDGAIGIGVDGSPATEPALRFAFQEAALRETGVVAVHATTGPFLTGPTDALIIDTVAERTEQHRLVAAALAPWRSRYPDVPVHETVCWDRPSRALVELSQRVALVVVGRRGRGEFPGRRLGSVTHALLHHAASPVAVVSARPAG